MAREAALAFFSKVREDVSLQRRLARLPRQDVKTLLRFANDVGYFFSARDYQAALEYDGELPEELRLLAANGVYIIPGWDGRVVD